MDREPFAAWVCCPRCRGDLIRLERGFRCDACAVLYPDVGKIPCLMSDPEATRERWRAELALIHLEAKATFDELAAEGRRPSLITSTQKRLDVQLRATRQTLAEIDEVLTPIGPAAMRGPPPAGLRPLSSLHLAHRDWSWEGQSDENERALSLVEKVIDAPLGRTLVIGAGACRLTYDLVLKHGATPTVALDIDPLIFTIADRVLRGDVLTLLETRSNATDLDRLTAPRTLKAHRGTVDGIHLVLADGLSPPLRPHSFDTVLTPWFIDLVPNDLRDFLGVIASMLAPGGRWLNFGPLLYPMQRPISCRFSLEEIFALAGLGGFAIHKHAVDVMPYALSPLTDRGRIEQVYAFSASRSKPFDPLGGNPGAPPPWLVLPWIAVPDFEGRASLQHESAAVRAVFAEIDGTRSIDDIARVLAAKGIVKDNALRETPGAIKDSVRFCLQQCHPAARSKLAP